MAQIRIPCLVGKTNKAGVTSWYWQPSKSLADAGWKPVALGKARDAAMRAAEARNAEVERWKITGEHVSGSGGQTAAGIRKRHQAGTLGALVARYRREVIGGRKENGEPLLAPSTQDTYGTGLNRLEAWAGKQLLAYITRARVRALKQAMLAPATTPRTPRSRWAACCSASPRIASWSSRAGTRSSTSASPRPIRAT
jgi:hypothetical protein